MVRICGCEKKSLADKNGVREGDVLISINGNPIADVLDYRYYLSEKRVVLLLERCGERYEITIRKGEYEDIGLEFETPLMDKKHSCKNGCIFCFIDQNPEGLRESLYFKDDDSRLSFLHGNYVTLTNMTDADIERIVKMRFSPINVSVHTTDPELRIKMMKNKRSGEVLKYLDTMKAAGIEMCGQIVLCRGVNDGDHLIKTLTDLAKLYPEMSSVAVVPAGLTKYRDGLYPLSDFSRDEAREVIAAVEGFAEKMYNEYGDRVFYAADELYLKAELPLPSGEYYGSYPQIENGVGMLRSFADEFEMAAEDVIDMKDYLQEPRRVTVATAVAAYPTIKEYASRLESLIDNLTVDVIEIKNRFFGESITVAGLLTGKDIAEALEGRDLGDEVLIPVSALSESEDIFLCGMTLSELEERLGVRVTPAENDGYEFARAVIGAE
ncbi:MAG: DUF512 domain-containing protein [Clostridia bacterium]|nr:DUF512 domain-containing protein [Clostridia bacterium]